MTKQTMAEFKHDASLKFEISHFTKDAIDIYKNLVEGGIKKSFDQLYEKIESEIKTNIAQKISGKDLYNYDDVEEIKTFDLLCHANSIESNYDIKKICRKISKILVNDSLYEDELPEFKLCLKQLQCEKIIIFINGFEKDYTNNKKITKNYLWLTNFGTLMFISQEGAKIEIHNLIRHEFWIPIDYIMIIKTIVESTEITNILCDNINNVLVNMKETLYNRKFVPLYVKDIVEENAQLKSKYEQYEQDNLKFLVEKEKFEKTYKPNLDLLKEKEDIESEKKILKMITIKLKLDNEKLEENIKKLEEEKSKINAININDFLGI